MKMNFSHSGHLRRYLRSRNRFILFTRHILTSFSSTLIDYTVFSSLYALNHNIILSTYTARGVSMIYNYTMLRQLVFQNQRSVQDTLPKYLMLAFLNATLSTLLIYIIAPVVLGYVLIAKILAELLLYAFNFALQRAFIFPNK